MEAGNQTGNPNQMICRIDGTVALSKFEMQLRSADISRSADPRDDLAAPDNVAALYEYDRTVRISRHPASGMFDENQITETLQLVSGIGDDTIFSGPDRRALPRRDIDTVIIQAAGTRTEGLNDFAP